MSALVEAMKPIAIKGEPLMLQQIALVCLIVVVAGFGLNGVFRDIPYGEFGWPVWVHGAMYLGWCLLACVQPTLIGRANRELHRRLGWLGVGMAAIMGISGIWITVIGVREGRLQPGNLFMMLNILTILLFWGLIVWAIVKRRNMAWHGRLLACATITLTGPAWARLLPMEYMGPFGLLAISSAVTFIAARGMIYDKRHRGKIHPAWLWGAGGAAAIGVIAPPLAFVPPFANWVATF